MGRPSLLRISDTDRNALLEAAGRSADARFRDACRAILMLAGGHSRDAVAAHFGVHSATIGRWGAAYRRRGVAGLVGPEEDRRGRPRVLQTEHLEWLRETVLTPPRQLGYAFTVWTLPRLARYLAERKGIRVQPYYLGRLLRRMRLARRRPKHVLEGKRDELAHAEAKVELAELKTSLSEQERVIISQDEAEFHLYPYLVAIWCVIGSLQPKVATPGKNQKRVLYGGLNLKTGRLTGYWAPTKSGGSFIEFLRVLVAEYPDQKILMITDNGSFHHTKKVDEFLVTHSQQLEVRWLPPYCPDLNDIERTWRKLKASHASNFLFNSLDELAGNVQRGIDELNRVAEAAITSII